MLQGLIESFKAGDRNLYEVAERLNVTEPFLAEALKDYRARFPKGVQVDNFSGFLFGRTLQLRK